MRPPYRRSCWYGRIMLLAIFSKTKIKQIKLIVTCSLKDEEKWIILLTASQWGSDTIEDNWIISI